MALSGSKSDVEEDSDDWIASEDDSEEMVVTFRTPPVYRTNTQAENNKRFRGPELDAGIWSALDDHVQEKIITRLPFRSLIQASSLSKTWKLRFQSASFQSEVHSSNAATSWESYSPLLVIDRKGAVVGYESSSESWYQLPTHSYLPKRLPQEAGSDFYMALDWHLWAADGSLFCWIGSNETVPNGSEISDSLVTFLSDAPSDHILVANRLTETWKQLPPHPEVNYPKFVHVICEERKAYKVLLGSLKDDDPGNINTRVQIFDSNGGSWTLESYTIDGTARSARFGCSAVMNGVLYVLIYFWNRTPDRIAEGLKFKLISLDLKERSFKDTPLLVEKFEENREPYFSQLLVCGSHLMLVMRALPTTMWLSAHLPPDDYEEEMYLRDLWVFRVDFDRCLAVGVSRAPRKMLSQSSAFATCNGECIWIGSELPCDSSICYDVGTQEWYYFNSVPDIVRYETSIISSASTYDWRWRSITYQPGLSPFLKV